MMQRAHVLLALAGVLASPAVMAADTAPPAPPAPKAGFNLFDAFMEGCIDSDPDAEAAAKALEARGAKRVPGSTRPGGDRMVSLDWSSRGPRLMVSYLDGMCAVSTNAADRDVSVRAFIGSRPMEDSTRLPRAESGVPDDFTYIAGFQMRAPGKSGGTTVMDVMAFQDDRPNPVLSMMVVVRAAAPDQPPPAPKVPAMPLVSAADVAAVFDQACLRPRGDAGGLVDFAQAQDAVWLGDENPEVLRYAIGDTKAAVALVSTPGNCAVLVDRLSADALKPALEAVLAPLTDISDIPEEQRPDGAGLTVSLARQGPLPGDADKRKARIFLITRPRDAGGETHMLMLANPVP